MATVVLVGTLDSKGHEYEWLKGEIEAASCSVHVVDVGVLGQPGFPVDTSREEIARTAGSTLTDLQARGDRGAALKTMSKGVASVVRRLFEEGKLHGLLAVGGSGGSSIAAAAMQALPIGVPKLLVSTMASGDVAPYVGSSDVTLMYSVVDIAGINRLSSEILGNAAAAICGMAKSYASRDKKSESTDRPLIAASMFGLTTPCVNAARHRLETLGYEVLVFHATGSGGKALEALAASGHLAGVLDITTTELADELVGGVLTAGPERLTAAGRNGVPQIVSLGALDMVNFGPIDTVPSHFAGRKFYEHNATVTLMRTSVDEMRELGRILGAKLRDATGPTTVLVPLSGVSGLDTPGGLFEDAEADSAMYESLRSTLAGSTVELVEMNAHINDEDFALAAATRLNDLIIKKGKRN